MVISAESRDKVQQHKGVWCGGSEQTAWRTASSHFDDRHLPNSPLSYFLIQTSSIRVPGIHSVDRSLQLPR
jgi:hypothetical protein